MRECTLITESRVEECGIVAQVVKCAPRVCGDDPPCQRLAIGGCPVLPAYAGMIPTIPRSASRASRCSPRMRG